MPAIKRRDGFEGEKLISLPDSVWECAMQVPSYKFWKLPGE